MIDPVEKNVRDLKAPFRTRDRVDRAATGAIELAYRRGYQAGFEDAQKKLIPRRKDSRPR